MNRDAVELLVLLAKDLLMQRQIVYGTKDLPQEHPDQSRIEELVDKLERGLRQDPLPDW